MKIELKDVFVNYQTKKTTILALKNINLTINENDFVVLYGPSGSGKTTLLKVLLGLIPYEGRITFNGIDANLISTQERNLSYISQKNTLYPNLTIFDNLAFPLKLQKISFNEIKQRIYEVTKELSIEWLLTRKPKQISLGQQQQVALAKSLLKNSEVFLFDEPFSNVDYKKRVELRHQIKKIHNLLNSPFIFVTHDKEEALALATHIVIIDNHEIIGYDSIENINKDPKAKFLKEYMEDE